MSGSWNTQKRIYELLAAAPTIASGGIYDHVPDGVASATAPDTAFPYVQIGETDIIPDDASTAAGGSDDGASETLTLHTWSRYRGQKETKELHEAIKTRLHGVELVVTGRSSALAWVRNSRSFMDPDGKTRHGVVSVEVIHRS